MNNIRQICFIKIALLGACLLVASAFGNIDSLKTQLNKTKVPAERVRLLTELAASHRYFAVDSALNYASRALALAEAEKFLQLRYEAVRENLKCKLAKGEFDSALSLVTHTLGDKNLDTYPDIKADVLSLAGYITRRKGKGMESLKLYQDCLDLSTEIEYNNGIAQAKKGLGDLLEKDGNYSEALASYKEARDIAEPDGDKELLASILNATGIIYDYQGLPEMALEYYISALDLCLKEGNYVKAAGISTNVASLHFEMENNALSLEYYEKALDLARQCQSQYMEADALQGMTVVLKNLELLERARIAAEMDLSLRKAMGDTRGMSFSYKNLGVIAQESERFELAETYYFEALKYARQAGLVQKLAVIYLQLGRLMNKTKQPDRAIPYLLETVDISKETADQRHEYLAYEALFISYALKGDLDKANAFHKLYGELRELQLSQEMKKKTVKMQTLFETQQRDERIRVLEKETQLKEEIIAKNKLNRKLSLAGIGSLFLIAGLFYNRSRLINKSNQALMLKNKEIEKQSSVIRESLEEKETLLREIHHRVKNNLQIISSLLNLQSKKIKDVNVLASINEGKNRVEAMSLIHQNLYQADRLSAINMKNYLNQLMGHLATSFNDPEKDIQYHIKAEDWLFDIDTAIPVGLILNELVSNAYKHAFNKKTSGNIYVSIDKMEDGRFILKVRDDGQGLPPDMDIKKTKSLGLKLVYSLGTKQLKGDIRFENKGGNMVELSFPEILKTV